MTVRLTVNGEARAVDAPPLTPLATVLRDQLALSGTKVACAEGFCGSCLVLVEGEPVASCLLPLGLLEGHSVETIEGLAPDLTVLTPLQQALKDHDAVQCGMCFPGMVMTLTHLLAHVASPSEETIRGALTGNICRCTGYQRIVEATVELARRDRS